MPWKTAWAAVFAIPLLGEWPSGSDWVGIVLVSAGVYLASGGPLPSRLRTGAGPSRVHPTLSQTLEAPDESV